MQRLYLVALVDKRDIASLFKGSKLHLGKFVCCFCWFALMSILVYSASSTVGFLHATVPGTTFVQPTALR